MGISPRTLRPSSTFSPRSISGLALWLDASSSDLYTTDAGPVVAVASPLDIAGCALWLDGADSSAASMTLDGTAVSAWKDKSGNGRDFTATTTLRPSSGTRTQNGRNVIDFDGTNNQMAGNAASLSLFRNVSSGHVFVVAKMDAATANQFIFSSSTALAGHIGRAQVFVDGSGNFSIGGRRLDADAFDYITATPTPTVPTVVSAHFDWANSDLFFRREGVVVSSRTTFQTDGSTTDANSVASSIGGAGAGFRLDGFIAEIVIYNTALTTAQRASVEAYLAAKWSISGVHAPATATSDPVGYWADKSGNGRHLLQPTSTARPTRVSSYVNGRTALTFDGTDFLSVANSVALGNNTVIMVVREDASANYGGLISYYPPSGNDNNNADGWVADLQLTDNVISLSSGIFAVQWTGAFSLPLSVLTLRRQTDAGNRQIIRANGVTNAVNANASTGTAAGILIGGRFQSGAIDTLYRAKITLCEVLRWDRALTPAEYTRAETALARKWGITLAPQVANADAQNWIDRVYANGGTVSSATAASVNQLCDSLDAASLRDRFYRLNLFCGSNLNAALVPLYRGPSLGGTQYGGATDTNVGGLFVSGDYNETGASGGLNAGASNSSKYLRTGITPSNMSAVCTNVHASVYSRAVMGSNSQAIGATAFSFFPAYGGNRVFFRTNGNSSGLEGTITTTSGHILAVRTGATAADLYRNGSSQGGTPADNGTTVSETSKLIVFGHADASESAVAYFPGTLQMYSLGLGMTAPQAAAFYSAVQAFQTSLTRNL